MLARGFRRRAPSGSSATSLITTSGSRTMGFIWWHMTKTPMIQTAEQAPYAYDKVVMKKLWDRSEKEAGFHWTI